MLIMVTGGSGSGKSEFAEQCCMKLCPGKKIYIATMQPFGTEGAARIQRHKKLRAGKHFQTVECYTDLGNLNLKINTSSADPVPRVDDRLTETDIVGKDYTTHCNMASMEPHTVLLECLSNLAANEMFTNELDETQTADKMLAGICNLRTQSEHLVVVTNDVFCDGMSYEEETVRYMKALAQANRCLAVMADVVCEVVCGIPMILKENEEAAFLRNTGIL